MKSFFLGRAGLPAFPVWARWLAGVPFFWARWLAGVPFLGALACRRSLKMYKFQSTDHAIFILLRFCGWPCFSNLKWVKKSHFSFLGDVCSAGDCRGDNSALGTPLICEDLRVPRRT